MNVDLFLYIAAVVLFCLAGFRVPAASFEWFAFAVLVVTLIV